MSEPPMTPDGQPLSFGALLRRYRRAAALTQEELAERARLSSRGVADLERGARRHPYRETLSRLAEALSLDGEQHAALVASALRARTGVGPTMTAHNAGAATVVSQASVTPLSWFASNRRPVPNRLHNLPAHLPALIGRDAELGSLVELIQRPDTGLVTLIGAGGSGKTRFAIAAGAALLSHVRDGV